MERVGQGHMKIKIEKTMFLIAQETSMMIEFDE